MTRWLKFGDSSLQHLLLGMEDCEKISRNQDWFAKWGEEGRRYKLERCSNIAGTFIRCSVWDEGFLSLYLEMEKVGEGLKTVGRETLNAQSGS